MHCSGVVAEQVFFIPGTKIKADPPLAITLRKRCDGNDGFIAVNDSTEVTAMIEPIRAMH